MFGTLFALLYAAHLAADYPLQTDRQAVRKAGWTEGDADAHPGRHHHGGGRIALLSARSRIMSAWR